MQMKRVLKSSELLECYNCVFNTSLVCDLWPVLNPGGRFTLWHGQDVDHPQFGYASWAYQGVGAFHRLYGQSKLAQIYHARYVAVQSGALQGSQRSNIWLCL